MEWMHWFSFVFFFYFEDLIFLLLGIRIGMRMSGKEFAKYDVDENWSNARANYAHQLGKEENKPTQK